MLELIEQTAELVTAVISRLGYLGLGMGMVLESACIPLPSELVLPLGGIMVYNGSLSLAGANLAANLGSLLGSCLAYIVGYFGGRAFILRHGKYFFISNSHFYRAESTFNRFGPAAVFFGRLLPVIRTFISLPAGITQMKFKKFILYSLLGMLPWNFALIYFGYYFGTSYDTVIRPVFKRFELAVIIGTGILIIFLIIKSVHKKRVKG